MGMTREQKQTEVQELNSRFATDELIVVAHYSGMTVKELTNLRGELRKNDAHFKVTKNTLAKLAVKGTKFEGTEELFKGPTGLASSQDPVAAARIAYQVSKTNKNFIIVGGALGNNILDAAGVAALAQLPSLDELRSKLVGLLVAAPTKLAGILQAPARDMVGVTKAYGEKG